MKDNQKSNAKLIGQRINAALATNDIKQKELAAALGVTDNTISYFANGARTPNTEQIIKISKFLKISSDYLLGLSDVPTNNKDLKGVCEYTGLKKETIEFFSSYILFDNEMERTFIDELVLKIKQNLSFNSDITDLAENVTVLTLLYDKGIVNAGKMKNQNINKSEKDDLLSEYDQIKENAETVELTINGLKYKISRFLNNFIEEFSLINAGINLKEFEETENEYYKYHLQK